MDAYDQQVGPGMRFTSHGTVLFVDTVSGEPRHGPLVVSPANVIVVREEKQALRFIGAGGQQDIVFLPEYSAVARWTPYQPRSLLSFPFHCGARNRRRFDGLSGCR
jgi:hypothetical protein